MEHSQYTWATFWGLAGFMAGIAVAFFLIPLWQSTNGISKLRRYRIIISVTSVFLIAAVVLYLLHGQPEAMTTVVPSTLIHGKDMSAPSDQADATAGSMEQAALRLAARLRNGGSDAEWNLLKQSYEFIGDSERASLAAQHRVKDTITEAPAEATTDTATDTATESAAAAIESAAIPDTALISKLAPFQQRVAANAKDSAAWLAIAELNRSVRNYSPANAAYAHVIALKKMTADSWADYADSSASLQKSLNNPQSIAAMDAALKLNPNHLKALWLKASLLHETNRYTEAVTHWQKLLALVPKESSDYRLIENNLNEARSLAGNSQPSATASITATVDVVATAKGKVTNDMVLFVFAKPVDSPGPPAAVLRVPVKSWPVNIVLDDSLSMMPNRKLSMFKSVNVQARLSRSGQALPQAGDIQSDVVAADVQSGKPLMLRLSKVIE
jgi:tetratricopeptide (TPR) repeat protein